MTWTAYIMKIAHENNENIKLHLLHSKVKTETKNIYFWKYKNLNILLEVYLSMKWNSKVTYENINQAI